METMTEDKVLVRQALNGDFAAMNWVQSVAYEVIDKKNYFLCKKHCANYHRIFKCTLDFSFGAKENSAPLCDFGNDSYEWMLRFLIHKNRLINFVEKEGEKLLHYYTFIIHSVPLLERWKDHRFGRRIRVPYYIQTLHHHAMKVFLYLYDGDDIQNIAQRLNMSAKEAKILKTKIEETLVKRNKLHTLYPTGAVTHTGEMISEPDYNQTEISNDLSLPFPAPESLLDQQKIQDALKKLDLIEKFILCAMDVDNLGANEVLAAIQEEGLQYHRGRCIDHIDQIYYIRNKARIRLKRFFIDNTYLKEAES